MTHVSNHSLLMRVERADIAQHETEYFRGCKLNEGDIVDE